MYTKAIMDNDLVDEELYRKIIEDIKNIDGVENVKELEPEYNSGFLTFEVKIKNGYDKWDILDKIHDLSFKYTGIENPIPIAINVI